MSGIDVKRAVVKYLKAKSESLYTESMKPGRDIVHLDAALVASIADEIDSLPVEDVTVLDLSAADDAAERAAELEDELAGLRILAVAWSRVPADARAAAIESLIDRPAPLAPTSVGPREGWMDAVFKAIDDNEAAAKVEREECAKLVDAVVTMLRERLAKLPHTTLYYEGRIAIMTQIEIIGPLATAIRARKP